MFTMLLVIDHQLDVDNEEPMVASVAADEPGIASEHTMGMEAGIVGHDSSCVPIITVVPTLDLDKPSINNLGVVSFTNLLKGVGKRVAFPVVENYVKNA
ncbi:hypothetical protein Tco_0365219 [Tanacetum coccineum]